MNKATNNMFKQGLLAMLVVLVGAGSALAQQSLFFSEYIEGGGDNKAFEIYNPTDAAVDLGNYIVLGNYNGNPFNDTLRFPMGTMLESMDVYVVAHANANAAITDVADSLVQNPFSGGSSYIAVFNGDDARALVHIDGTDSTIVDMFGTTEEDPGSGWDVAGVTAGTKDKTLVRKAFIKSGNPVPLASFGVGMMSSEWEVYEKDDLSFIGSHSTDAPATIRDFNTYPGITEFSVDAIQGHPLNGETIRVTAVITSYPKSSGLSNPRDSDNDGVIDAISRIHVFVTDTHAVSMGREGMSIQLVESDYTLLDSYTRGDIITFDATLGFFRGTSQVGVDNVELVGNVNGDYPEYATLITPWEISMTELNVFTGTELYMDIEGYLKYNGAYVKFPSTTVTQAGEFGGRVDWSVNKDGSRMYVYDTSLRFRNDHAIGAEGYIPSYNARRIDGEDGAFEAPASGASVDISGFVNYVGDDPDGLVPSGSGALSINPFEDGVVWLNENRFVDGQDVGGTTFSWPNDVVVNGLPPVFSNIMLSDSSVTSTDEVVVSADVVGTEGATIAEVTLTYSADGTDSTVTMANTSGDTYAVTLPAFANFTAAKMGKVTGFKEYDRQTEAYRPVSDRINDYGEIFTGSHNEDQLQTQGARCMDCGVPFCQSDNGCPINNLIPEWNDLVYNGQWKTALERLLKTNNFPEFTGRVCPAPCEGSCVLGMNNPAVTIKNIELAIIDKGFKEGWIKPYQVEFRTGKKSSNHWLRACWFSCC
jgi:hypothetical protein